MKWLFVALFALNLWAGEVAQNDIDGIWEFDEEIGGNVSIGEIFTHDNRAFAYAFDYEREMDGMRVRRDIQSEESNAAKLRGKIFIAGLEFDGAKWINGRIFNPNNAKTYYISAELSGDKQTLNLRASLDRFGVLGQTLQWRRVADSTHTPPSHDTISIIDELKGEDSANNATNMPNLATKAQ